MHLKETPDDMIDVKSYWTFKPEVENITKAAGNRFWGDFENLADSYPCAPCKRGAQAIAHGGHDLINVLLGKPPQTPKQLADLLEMSDEVKRRLNVSHCTGGKCVVAPRAAHRG